ncbi:MAG: hypothetical protein M1819_005811 [Sarea resinae]|nr:MAG: hypothetical protein M1819_005811 [Sarea resinae]
MLRNAQTLARSVGGRCTPVRSLTSTAFTTAPNNKSYPDDEHVTDKDGELDVQSAASGSAKRSRAEGSEQSQAVSEKDTGNHNARAKKDNPKAPTPVIGMNDERGGKGH